MHAQVGLIACNDYILLECCIYNVIKRHFAGHSSYVHILDLFHDVGSVPDIVRVLFWESASCSAGELGMKRGNHTGALAIRY